MNIDDRVEIVGEGKNSGKRHIGKTGAIGATDGAYFLVHFDVLDSPYDTCAWFPADSLELVREPHIDLSRLEDCDPWTAARALAEISRGAGILERLNLYVSRDGLDMDALVGAIDRELHLRLQVNRAAFGGAS